MNFVGADKKRFQLEVTETASQRADHRYEVQGQRKGIAPSGSSSFRSFLRVFFFRGGFFRVGCRQASGATTRPRAASW